MNSFHTERSSDHKYPAIVLDMTNFMEHLSDEYVCKKGEVRVESVRTSPKIDCKTEDCIDLRQITSVEGEEEVRKLDTESVI